MCNTLAISLLVAGKSLGLSFLCGKTRYRCDVCCTYIYIYQGSTVAGATANSLTRSCIMHFPTFWYTRSTPPMDCLKCLIAEKWEIHPHWLASHLVDVCMCLIHHYRCWKRGSVVLITVTSYQIRFVRRRSWFDP